MRIGSLMPSSFENVTFAYNFAGFQGGSMDLNSSATVTNCIFWGSLSGQYPSVALPAEEIWVRGGATLDVDYSLINLAYVRPDGVVNSGPNIQGIYPIFADEANDDYHLASPFGRWFPPNQAFVYSDPLLSPGVDMGDPTSPFELATFAPSRVSRQTRYSSHRFTVPGATGPCRL